MTPEVVLALGILSVVLVGCLIFGKQAEATAYQRVTAEKVTELGYTAKVALKELPKFARQAGPLAPPTTDKLAGQKVVIDQLEKENAALKRHLEMIQKMAGKIPTQASHNTVTSDAAGTTTTSGP